MPPRPPLVGKARILKGRFYKYLIARRRRNQVQPFVSCYDYIGIFLAQIYRIITITFFLIYVLLI